MTHETVHKLVSYLFNCHNDGNGHATLPGRPISAMYNGTARKIEIRIGHDYDMIFGATECLYPFTGCSCLCIHGPGNGTRTDETYRGRSRMSDEPIGRLDVSLNNVHDSRRKTCFYHQLGGTHGCRRSSW